jgi:DNA-directed RNA polymerase subunit D
MKLTKVTDKELQVTYDLSDTTPAFANALRRYCIDYVPTLAIEDVEFKSNDSILYDEVIAHRLGLISLSTDLSSYTLAEEGEEISAMNSVVLTLSKSEPGYVYAKDFQTKDPKVKPVYGDTQITYLVNEQTFEIIVTAVMGVGKDHAKWSPANVSYTYKPSVKVNNQSSQLKDVLEKFPPQVVKDGKIDEKAITTPALLDACDGICDDVVKIDYDSTSFIFTVESFGQLQAKEVVVEAINQFNTQLDELKGLVKELN